MKITNFSTLLISSKSDELIALFKELGFEPLHVKEGIDSGKVTSNILQTPQGDMISIASAPIEHDMTVIRMNVDNFAEAYSFLKKNGFRNSRGTDEIEDTGTSIAALLVSPSGLAINVTQHIK